MVARYGGIAFAWPNTSQAWSAFPGSVWGHWNYRDVGTKAYGEKRTCIKWKRQRHVPSWPLLCFQSLWGQTLRATVSLTTIKLNKGGDLSVYKEQLIKKKKFQLALKTWHQ